MAINTDTLVLRDTANPPLTNKQAVLDVNDFDQNLIKVYNDFLALSVTNSVDAYNASTVYDDTIVQYATFSGRTYKWINGTPGSGITPDTDPLKWLEVFPTELAHRKNSDLTLAEGTSDEVTAAEIRAYIDGGLTTTTDLSITTHTGTSLLLNSSTGADVTFSEANATQAGLLSATGWQQLQQTSGVNSGDQTLSSLGAEPAINKAIDFSVVNDDLFPSVQAVQTQITAFSNNKLDQNLTVNTVLDMGGQELDITNGILKIGSAYTLIQTDGTTGQVLTTNGAGVTSWSAASGNGIFDIANDGGTVPTSFNINLTDTFTFDGGDFKIQGISNVNLFSVDYSTDRIGVGKLPSYPLDVLGTIHSNSNILSDTLVQGTQVGANSSVSGGGYVLQAKGSGGTSSGISNISASSGSSQIDIRQASGNMYFDLRNTTGDSKIYLNSGGDSYIMDNLGIGTASPSSKLDVNGDVEIGDANAYYLGDPTTDGSWRITRIGDDLLMQQREAAVWNTKQTISGA